MSETHKQNHSYNWKTLAFLSLLMGFASLSTDIYLPAMPAIGDDLHVPEGMMEWTISAYLIGFSLGQLFWGPFSDHYGRRLPIALGLILFILGSTGCAVASNIWIMIGARFIQALGACASVVLSRAMVRDLYKGADAAKLMSSLITIMAIAPLIGPLLGGQILLWGHWHFIFGLLILIGATTLLLLYTFPETLSENNRSKTSLSVAFHQYVNLLKKPRLLAYIGVGGFFYAGAYAYIAAGPHVFIRYHHLPAQYFGFIFALGIAGIMLCNIINSKIVHRISGTRLLLIGGIITALSGIALIFAGTYDLFGIVGLIIPLFFYMSMNGLIVANAMTGALEDFPEAAGSISALLGSLQYGAGIFASFFVGYFADGTARPMSYVIGICAILTLISAFWIVVLEKRFKKPRSRLNNAPFFQE